MQFIANKFALRVHGCLQLPPEKKGRWVKRPRAVTASEYKGRSLFLRVICALSWAEAGQRRMWALAFGRGQSSYGRHLRNNTFYNGQVVNDAA